MVTKTEIVERMVRDMMRLGIPEGEARILCNAAVAQAHPKANRARFIILRHYRTMGTFDTLAEVKGYLMALSAFKSYQEDIRKARSVSALAQVCAITEYCHVRRYRAGDLEQYPFLP